MGGCMKNRKRLTAAALIIGLLIYALFVLVFQIFPYDQIVSVRNWARRNMSTRASIRSEIYQNKVFSFEHNTVGEFDVVFVGDSLTDEGMWNEYFDSVRIANRGVYGDTTRGVLERMDTILSTHADTAFVLLGVNDIFMGAAVDEIVERYREIVDLLLRDGMDVYIQSTLFALGKHAVNNKVLELNDQLVEIAESRSNAVYVDVISSLTEEHYKNDAIHLNAYGYLEWSSIIREYVDL